MTAHDDWDVDPGCGEHKVSTLGMEGARAVRKVMY